MRTILTLELAARATPAPTTSRAQSPACNPDPGAPHGLNRSASHDAGRYVCDCEGWALDNFYFDFDDGGPYNGLAGDRMCECGRAADLCDEYQQGLHADAAPVMVLSTPMDAALARAWSRPTLAFHADTIEPHPPVNVNGRTPDPIDNSSDDETPGIGLDVVGAPVVKLVLEERFDGELRAVLHAWNPGLNPELDSPSRSEWGMLNDMARALRRIGVTASGLVRAMLTAGLPMPVVERAARAMS